MILNNFRKIYFLCIILSVELTDHQKYTFWSLNYHFWSRISWIIRNIENHKKLPVFLGPFPRNFTNPSSKNDELKIKSCIFLCSINSALIIYKIHFTNVIEDLSFLGFFWSKFDYPPGFRGQNWELFWTPHKNLPWKCLK